MKMKNVLRERHEELLQKVRTGVPMTRDEMKEAERLGKTPADSDQLIAQEMQAQQEQRNRLRQQAARVQQDIAWNHIFNNTTVQGVGHPDDSVANRQIIWGWLDEARGDVFSVDWFAKVISEQPQLAQQLSWTKPQTAKERKAQAEKTAQASREKALATCRQYGLSECEANLHILMNHDGIVVWVANGPTLMTDVVDEGELPLVAASQAELQKYATEKEAARVGHLQNLAKTNNVAELRRIAKQDAMGQQESFESTRQQILNRDLAFQFERDQMAGYVTPLPAQITPEQIRKWDANQMRSQMKRYGASRISARLHQITEVPNGRGGTYKFE